MRKFLLSAAAVFTGAFAFGQQDYQLSHYMFDRLSLNPAYAGIEDQICGSLFYRNQWMQYDGAPKTFLMNVSSPLPWSGGAGLSIFSDKIGFFNNFTGRLAYSHHFIIPSINTKLGVGASVGYMSVNLKPSWIAIDDPTLDQAIPDGNTKESSMDFSLGIYAKGTNWYAGISATHLTESELTSLNVKNTRHYYIIGGYDYAIQGDPAKMLRGSVRVETDAASTQFDLNVNYLWNQMVWGGLSYRLKDAIIPMAGYQQALAVGPKKYASMLRIGLAYDVTTSNIKDYSSGSFEIYAGFCMKVVKVPPIHKYRNTRKL
jgi:type IX secretion system PorP/SprF family membrane protein